MGIQDLTPIKALRAAALLGDYEAITELRTMRTNAAIFATILTICSGLVVIGYFGLQSCDNQARVRVDRDMVETRAHAELLLKQQADAAQLRLRYVQSCRVTPEQAETLVQPKGATQ